MNEEKKSWFFTRLKFEHSPLLSWSSFSFLLGTYLLTSLFNQSNSEPEQHFFASITLKVQLNFIAVSYRYSTNNLTKDRQRDR